MFLRKKKISTYILFLSSIFSHAVPTYILLFMYYHYIFIYRGYIRKSIRACTMTTGCLYTRDKLPL